MGLVAPVSIPTELGVRLQQLFDLDGSPATIEELAKLVQGRWQRSLKQPGLSKHLRAIYSGTEIFGRVNYETPQRVKLPDGRHAYAACALDAIIEGFFLPVEIESTCFHCKLPVKIQISEGGVTYAEPPSVIIWLGANRGETCSCETDACPYINFFASEKHATDWKGKNPTELGIALSLEESLSLARRGWWEPIHLTLASA